MISSEYGTRRLTEVLAGVVQAKDWKLTEAWGLSADGRFVTGHGIDPSGLGESWITDIQPANVSELFAKLLADVTGVGPDRKLEKTVTLAQTYYESHDMQATCSQLTYFDSQVQKLPLKKVSQIQKDDVIGQSLAIMDAIGCQ